MNARNGRWPRSSSSGYTLLEVMLVLALLTAIAGVTWPALMRPWARHELQLAARAFAEQIENARLRAMEESRVYELKWRPGSRDFEITSPDQPPAEEFPAVAGSLKQDAASATTDRDATGNEPSQRTAQLMEHAASELSTGESPRQATATISSLGQEDGGRRWRVPRPTHVHNRLDHGASFQDPQRAAGTNTDADLLRLLDSPAERNSRDADAATGMSQHSESADGLPGDGAALQPGTAGEGLQLPVPWAASVWIYPEGRTSNMQWTLVSEDGYEVDVELRGLTGNVRISPPRRTSRARQDADSPNPEESLIHAAADPQPRPTS